jgi:hypothetical protein
MWAITTGKPVLSIDYGKAPECTFKAFILFIVANSVSRSVSVRD